MFDTHHALDTALATSHTWSALHAALHASGKLATQALDAEEPPGLCFFEPAPRVRNTPISGRITIDPATGTMTLHAVGLTGSAWYTALERLGTLAANDDGTPAWSWQPHRREQPGALAGTVQLGSHITAQAAISAGAAKDLADAALALTPATRDTCQLAWSYAITVLGTLTTGDPAYRPAFPTIPDAEISTSQGTGLTKPTLLTWTRHTALVVSTQELTVDLADATGARYRLILDEDHREALGCILVDPPGVEIDTENDGDAACGNRIK